MLEEAAEAFALYAQADYPRRAVDLVDRFGRHEPAAAGEEAGADGERVGLVRSGPVHRALDPADDPAAVVGDEVAAGAPEVVGERAHAAEAIPGL